jgi:biotin transporter BioY
MGEGRGGYMVLVKKSEGYLIYHLLDPGVDGRIILRLIFRKGMWRYGLD